MASHAGRAGRGSWWEHLLLLFAVAFAVLPVLWVVSASLQPREVIVGGRLALLPTAPTLENYRALLLDTPFLRWFANSVLVAGLTTAIGLFFAATAAFAFSQLRFPGRQAGLTAFLVA